MKINYGKSWESMNSLEQTISKVVSSKEIIDSAIFALQEHQYEKAENLMQASYEFLEYYIVEFEEKFKSAWKHNVIPIKNQNDKVIPFNGKVEMYTDPSIYDDIMEYNGYKKIDGKWQRP